MVKSLFTVAVCCKLAGALGVTGVVAGGYDYYDTHKHIQTVPGVFYNLPDYWEAEEDTHTGIIKLETKMFDMDHSPQRNHYDIVRLKAAPMGLSCDGVYALSSCRKQEAMAREVRHQFCQHANITELKKDPEAKAVVEACAKDKVEWIGAALNPR